MTSSSHNIFSEISHMDLSFIDSKSLKNEPHDLHNHNIKTKDLREQCFIKKIVENVVKNNKIPKMIEQEIKEEIQKEIKK